MSVKDRYVKVVRPKVENESQVQCPNRDTTTLHIYGTSQFGLYRPTAVVMGK